jgi:hypothetical protein
MLQQHSDYLRLYEILGRYLAEGYAVVYAAEPDPDKVLERMSRVGIEIDRYLKSGTLEVTSEESIYISDNEKNFNPHFTIESWYNVISRVMSNTHAKGVLAIGSTDIFLKHGQDERVIEYEKNTGKRFQNSTEAVCCYTADSLSDTSVATLISILNAHEYIIHDDANRYSEWKDDKLQDVLTSAFNKVLGSTTSDLMLKTLKSVYKVDEKTILSDPAILEHAVGKFFKDSSAAILAAILKDLKREIAFCRPQSPSVPAS